MRNFQRDGHMQMGIPKGRVSYSPSSLDPSTERTDPKQGFTSFAVHETGDKLRIRSATFADHFSQARQFFFSQTEPEQNHIISAFIFELSKVETEAVRQRLLGQLANVDQNVAERVAAGLGYEEPIEKADTSVTTRTDLKPSPMLSILAKFSPILEGRLVGCLVADGTDPHLVTALETEVTKLGASSG